MRVIHINYQLPILSISIPFHPSFFVHDIGATPLHGQLSRLRMEDRTHLHTACSDLLLHFHLQRNATRLRKQKKKQQH